MVTDTMTEIMSQTESRFLTVVKKKTRDWASSVQFCLPFEISLPECFCLEIVQTLSQSFKGHLIGSGEEGLRKHINSSTIFWNLCLYFRNTQETGEFQAIAK